MRGQREQPERRCAVARLRLGPGALSRGGRRRANAAGVTRRVHRRRGAVLRRRNALAATVADAICKRLAFACCDADGSSGCTRTVSGSCDAGHWTRSPPWAPVKWSDAMKHCATYGKTLCGSSDAARCQNKGCYYNSIYQWTNEPCEPGDEGYECTTP